MLDLPVGKHILKYNLAQASGTQEINIIKDKILNVEASIGGLITAKIIFEIKYLQAWDKVNSDTLQVSI